LFKFRSKTPNLNKINLGCGGNKLPGWTNYDAEVDISQPLPFGNKEVDFLLAEHVVEHVSFHQAYSFFEECYRVLKPNGVARILTPGIDRIWDYWTPEYGEKVRQGGFADGTKEDCVRAIIFQHGHLAGWTQELLGIVLTNIGFSVNFALPRLSMYKELTDVDGHYKVIGEAANSIETIIAEAKKPEFPNSRN
jgi:SAM-dependent methyltransferase